jgi:hypothetical protein
MAFPKEALLVAWSVPFQLFLCALHELKVNSTAHNGKGSL